MRIAFMLILVSISAYGQAPGSCVCAATIASYPAGTEPSCNASTRASVIISLGDTGQPDLLKACVRDGAGRFQWTPAGQQNPNSFTNVRSAGGCPVFPDNNVWNSKADSLPRDADSAAIVGTYANARVGIDPTMAINFADATTPGFPVTFSSASNSDPGQYPIGSDMKVEGYGFNQSFTVAGGPYKSDAHLLVVRTDTCKLYEIFALGSTGAPYTAGSGAVYDLTTNDLRPDGWTSADGAGLPIWPGILTYDDVFGPAEIQHMVRFSVDRTRNTYVWPARHYASKNSSAALPPMGSRWRLKADFDEATCHAADHSGESYPPEFQKVIRALKNYGMILADNGKAILITAESDPRWGDPSSETSPLYMINGWTHCIMGSNFEVVDNSPIMTNLNSAAVAR
jgi:hypothetical protein